MNGEEGGRRASNEAVVPSYGTPARPAGCWTKIPPWPSSRHLSSEIKHLLWEGQLNVDLENEMEQNPLKHPA